VVVVQSEETESLSAEFVTEELEIPALQLASFAADQDERHVLERKNHHRTSCGFPELQCAASFSFIP
jgi:hypothetical protein